MKPKLGKTLFIVIFLLLLLSAIPLALMYKNKNTNQTKETKKIEETNLPPSFVTSPPAKATVNQNFDYRIRVTDPDTNTESLIINYVEGPQWLLFDGSGLVGTPSTEDIGNSQVDIIVDDGDNTVHQTFYLVVTEDGEDS